jgi:hypothetical protein
MSAAEIIKELPKLNHADRREIARLALELNWGAAEREAMELAEAASEQLAQFIAEDEAAHETR